ncbi:hypothetical protein F4825DRAFT_406499 [Nemania diffusa]|nr:hypothetical protein F4825DRAFT_406499 [Nemania diffusa]
MAQTLEQRKRNAKFVKDQDARRGKAETDIKKRTKDTAKSPISPFWLGEPLHASTSTLSPFPSLFRLSAENLGCGNGNFDTVTNTVDPI